MFEEVFVITVQDAISLLLYSWMGCDWNHSSLCAIIVIRVCGFAYRAPSSQHTHEVSLALEHQQRWAGQGLDGGEARMTRKKQLQKAIAAAFSGAVGVWDCTPGTDMT